ncbi:MAG: glycosyltransferase family 4 protein, partial [Candidatus Omnitrophota bacterium]|nr:glycosyltransferase family 4 protein [Candidatus Omnitrophota bacterium]
GYDFQFLIVGSPLKNEIKYLENVNKLISNLDLEGKIKITGFVTDIASIYRLLDIVVIPSTQFDSFPTVALEAMAMKKPVIASNIGGLPEMVIDGETGILVKPSDDKQLKSAIEKLAADEGLRKKMGEAGYERQNKYFNIADFQQKINALIKELL